MPQRFIDVDEDYLKLLQVPLVAGRGFSAQGATRGEVLVNETLMRKVGYKTPQAALGQLVSQGRDDPASRARIVGVVKDFHFLSPHFPIEPLVLLPSASTLPEKVLIRLSTGKLEAQLEWVAREWKRLVPDHPFEFTFLDETFNQQYQQEQRLVPLFTYFSLVTILVACLGLFGLVSFAARLRSKEVGIRKVLGAREGSLILLLTREYLLLVVGGILLASPLAWYLVNRWLEGFAYRITISGWMFVLSGGVAILIASLTTGYHARKAARTDPVRALRYE
jgi:putative ABC transport system permease protein